MRPYLAILGTRFRLLLQYRAAAAAGVATQFFWGLVRMMIFAAFYANATSAPMSWDQTLGYIWLCQAFIVLMILGVDPDIQQQINTGNIAYELLRPVDLYFFWYGRALAARTAPAMLRAVPLLLIATLAGWIRWPGGVTLLAWGATMAGAVLLSSAIALLMTITLLWTVSGTGMMWMVFAVTYALGGLLVPLPLLPESWQVVINALPFRGVGDVPFRIFTGNLPPAAWPMLVLHQLAWTVGLVLLGRWLLRRGMRHVVVQGG